MTQGLQAAARQVQSFGRGPDTMLAHIAPDEAQFIDYMQGGRRTNPHTGLPEYGLFGNILKFVARAAGAIGGFAVGGPAGAAAGAGLATKLTGGSWKDALTGAALAGVGSWGVQGLSGGGWSALGAHGATSAAAGAAPGIGAAAGHAGIAEAALAPAEGAALSIPLGGTAAGATATGGGTAAAGISGALHSLGAATAGIGGLPGLTAGALAGMNAPQEQQSAPTPLPHTNINLDVLPASRQYRPYQGDYSKFGEPGGAGGYQFFDNVNPMPVFRPQPMAIPEEEIPRYALGGPVGGRGIGMVGQNIGPQMPEGPRGPMGPGVPGGGVNMPNQRQQGIMQAAMRGYLMGGQLGMARGGAVPAPSRAAQIGVIRGPGGPTDDAVPAMLSNNEHVFDAATVRLAGRGSYERGHQEIEKIKQHIRSGAGMKNPKQPPHTAAVSRAKYRAGIGA